MSSDEAGRRRKKRAASASAKAIAAAPSAGRAGAISCRASSARPPPRAESRACASGSRRRGVVRSLGRPPGRPASASISATTRRKCVIASALPLGDIRPASSLVPYLFLLWTERGKGVQAKSVAQFLQRFPPGRRTEPERRLGAKQVQLAEF